MCISAQQLTGLIWVKGSSTLTITIPGIMAGMSRDKCGAADVAGFMKVVDALKPKNVKVWDKNDSALLSVLGAYFQGFIGH